MRTEGQTSGYDRPGEAEAERLKFWEAIPLLAVLAGIAFSRWLKQVTGRLERWLNRHAR